MNAPDLSEVVTETRYGPMTYYAADQFIGRSLELYGEYSPDEVTLLMRLCRPEWTVVNGGANIGALAIPLATKVAQVYAFEPQPEAYKLLKKNTKGRTNIILSPYALWHSRGDEQIRLYKELGHDNFGCTALGSGTARARTIALDDWLQGELVDMIVLDVEGSEMMALEGAKRTIGAARPILYLEDHELENPAASDLVKYVRGLGYLCYSHVPDMYSPENWKKCPENVFSSIKNVELKPYKIISSNILCVPSEKIAEFRDLLGPPSKFQLERDNKKLKLIVPKGPGAQKWAGIARCGGIGDNLIAAAALRPLKEAGYSVEVITQRPQSVVFENNPFIDKLSVYDESDWPTDFKQWQDMFARRAKEYEKFANLSHSIEARHALMPVQTWYWYPQEYRRKFCAGSYLETQCDILGVPHSFGPLFFPTDEEREQAQVTKRKLGQGPIIGWCLSGSRIDKVYPYSPLVIARLIKELNAQVVMLGAPPPHRDFELAKRIMESVTAQNGTVNGLTHAASPNLQQETWPIRRVLTFAGACDLYIGNDTGPSWGVAFEPLPKIIMVSHTSAENITKHWINTETLHADASRVSCWPCHRLHDTFETCRKVTIWGGEFAACSADINAEVIVTTAARLLNGGNRNG